MNTLLIKISIFTLLCFVINLESTWGFGSMGSISAAFGKNSFFCAIDASGKQDVICWGSKNNSNLDVLNYPTDVPSMFALSGGDGFLCGILSNTSQAFCFDSMGSSSDLVPLVYKTNGYSRIAAGRNHVCAIRGMYYSESDWGSVDCWDIIRKSNGSMRSSESSLYYNQYTNSAVFKSVVSGDGFSCGGVKDGGVLCWGPKSSNLGISRFSENVYGLTAGIDSVCGVLEGSNEVKCWGANKDSFGIVPAGMLFVSLAAGVEHFCGIRQDNHGIMCWGKYNSSLIPKGSGFLAIASSEFITCGIREGDLVLDCWYTNVSSKVDYDPPLQLCSPGLCTPSSCSEGKFSFNASLLNEPDLINLCVRKDLQICSPCGVNCSEGFFASSSCTENADRVCTPCSLCQNSSCSDVCKLQISEEMKQQHQHQLRQLLIIVGSSALSFLFCLAGLCLLIRVITSRSKEGGKNQFGSCIRKPEKETDANTDPHPPVSVAPCPGEAQIFRLSELKDATNGFKEFNELGRGSYGFVYKAVLPDGRQVAVKRANAATIIHINSREFEMELEILCSVRHSNIVNLLGYCAEMGERILVYELMPHGTLNDHLHGGLSPVSWNLRLKIAMQAAKGLEYLHKEVSPPIVHRDMKSSNILLDADWGARIADFGLLTPNEKDLNGDVQTDVYNFGIVLLEILSGRKAYDRDCTPPSIVDWALPLIRQGKAAVIIDRYVALPRNVEPLLKLAEIAEQALRENPAERPDMSQLALLLEQLVKDVMIS
ncbi:Serine/threonine-protein kinase-like protein CCR1 [Capsicum annuum]|uniref:serine/threonine-protein kinase-like protein CCR1 n=1 Tax=Capsicum annuum TaxID=4072 RepID=UPI001FB15C57|nr:serine/threonine-protein kinase-like protein CCR1 [Capsicum annuum]KAF3659323.1 Serine/threonine-protein kinase-like protein CCR1 [Capsicum annuum]